MSSLIITKQTGNFFSLVLDGGSPIISEQNRLTTVGNFCNFKTANGANLILKQNILYSDITIVTGFSHVPTSINDLWISLLDAGFFDGLATTGGSSTIDKFTELLDTFSSYIGRDGQLLVVNESEQKIETIAISLFSEDDRAKLDGIETGAQVNVQSNWNETDPLNDAFIQNKPDLGLGCTAEDVANKVSVISGYDVDLYPNEKATHNALDLKLNISDLPTNLTLYPTTTTSDVSGYVVMVKDIHDVRYNSTAVDVSTPTITGVGQLISQRISDAGVLIGQPGVFNITTFGNIRRLSGSGTATFYFEVYRRDLAGVETLISTSSISNAVVNGAYAEFTASGLWDDGDFVATDRIVIKSYANRIAGGSDPVYQFQFGGATPVRTLLPVPFSVVDAGYELRANKQNNLTPDGTGTKYPTVDAVNAVLPTSYSKIVYVNATSPTTATIFDLENPPVTNDNLLKNDTANLYIGTDASTWVYLTGTGYVTKTISSATSNFNTFGTTVDAGNSKTSHITRSGPVTLTGSLNLAVAKISTTPNTSAGSYDILTRNSSTTALEKKTVSDFVQTTTAQSITGRKNFTSDNTVSGGISIVNSKTTSSGFSDNFGLTVFNTGNTGIYVENTGYDSTGVALSVVNQGGTGVGLRANNFGAGNLIVLRNQGGTGDLLSAELGKVTISSAGKLSTTEVATTGNNVTNKTYVDAKITQTITNGVTDKSPSEDAVYDALALKVGGSGTTNYVPKFTASGTVGNSQIFDNGTNVGIGTASPFTFFTLNKSSNSNATASTASMMLVNTLATLGDGVTTFNSARMLFQAGNGAVDMRFKSDYDSLYSGGTIGTYSSHPIKIVTTGADRLTITSGGSTLINTTIDDGVATNKLQVNGNITSNVATLSNQVVVKSQLDAIRPYKIYTALMTQSGTSAPVATVLENTLGGTVVWTRTSSGSYVGTLAGAFVTNKTVILYNASSSSFSSFVKLNTSNNTIDWQNGSDDRMLNNGTMIEIRVYN